MIEIFLMNFFKKLKVVVGRERNDPNLGYYGIDEIIIAPYEGADVAGKFLLILVS